MLALMAYATLASALLAGAAAVLEQNARWLSGSRRFLWLVTMAGALCFLASAVSRSATRPVDAIATRTVTEPLAALPSRGALPASGPTVALPAAPLAATRSVSDLDGLLVWAWLIASALCVGLLGASVWRLARMRRDWREAVIAGVPVLVSHDVGPAVIGIIHHGIVVPEWVETLDDDAQRAVMTHEREHVRAGDPLLLWGATLLVAMTPWNAALWYSLRRLRHAIEMDCDARVLRLRPDRHAYCRLLLDVSERTMAGVAPMAALAEPSTMLERRIRAMTAHASVSRRVVTAAALASLVLVAAAFATPRPAVRPTATLGTLLTPLRGTMAGRANGLRTATPVSDRRLPPQWNAALRALYPQLRERADTTAMMVVLTYDARRRLRGSSIQPMPVPVGLGFEAPDFSSVQIQFFGMYKAPILHTTVVPVVEKWDIDAEPALSVYGGRRSPAESRNVPPERQLARRVDSLAHANVPQAFTTNGDPQIVTVLFDADARVVRWFNRPIGAGESVDATIQAHGPAELLARVLPAPLPSFTTYGAYTFHDAPSTIFLYAELAPSAQRASALLTESRAIVSLKPILTTQAGEYGTTGLFAREEQNRTVLVYTTGSAAMSAGGEVPRARRDTLRVRLPGTVSLELNRPGDVHFVSEDGRPFDLAGILTGAAAAQELSARGQHLMIMSGGWGIRAVR